MVSDCCCAVRSITKTTRVSAAAVPDEVVRQTLQQIKDMGANFVRLGHYQQAPLVLEFCDQLGLLVWEEIPWCRGGLGGDRYQQQCRDMLRNMIDQHYNHPAVILWGLGNENDWPGDFETLQYQCHPRVHDRVEHARAPARSVTQDVYPPLRFLQGHSRRVFAEHLGRLVFGSLHRVSRRDGEMDSHRAAILPRRVGRRQPRAPLFGRPGKISDNRLPPAKAPRKPAKPTSQPVARPARRGTATGRRVISSISSTGISRSRSR